METTINLSPAKPRKSNLFQQMIGLLLRLWQLVIVLWIISTLLFFLLRLTGDPAALLAGDNATPESIEKIRQAYGFADPLPIQYANFLWGAIRLDFGESIQAHVPATGLILERIPATTLLAVLSLGLAIVIAIPLGTLAAVRRGRLTDRLVTMTVALGQSIPGFVFGLLLIFLFAVTLKWLPSFGQEGPQYLIMPVLTLSLAFIAQLTRLVRSNMIEVLSQDYIRTARSKGLAPLLVLWRHALRNTFLTLLTVLGLNISILVGGSIIVEQLFSWPGVGQKMANSITLRDFPVVQAGVFFIALLVFSINALVDFLYQYIDPRLRKK